jgi:hypothetical protein
MPLDAIPPDQRAVLQLVLQQGRSYDDLAGLLGIESTTVRRRAHDALGALGPVGTIDASDQAHLGDYLLGQQPVSEREAARELLSSDPAARDWANAVSREISELAPGGLPEIPSGAPETLEPGPVPPRAPRRPEREPDARSSRDREPVAAGAREPEPEGEDDTPYGYFPAEGGSRVRSRSGGGGPSSRLGGAIILGGVAIVIAVVLILVLSGGKNDKGSSSTTSTATTQAASGASGATSVSGATGTSGVPNPIAQVQLRAADGSKAVGLAQIFARGKQRAVIVAGQGVTAGAYALWLYNSQTDSQLLGFVPSRVGTNGRFVTQGSLPAAASKFKEMIVTREAVSGQNPTLPKAPGTIVLRGTLKGVSS